MEQLDRIEKIFRMLGSTHDGEIINAVNHIRKTLIAQNKNFNDLADILFARKNGADYLRRRQGGTSQADKEYRDEWHAQQRRTSQRIKEHSDMCLYLIDMPTVMTNWESTFISDIYNTRLLEQNFLSVKQEEMLNKIYRKYYKEKAKKA